MTDLVDTDLPALIQTAASGDELAVFEALLAQLPVEPTKQSRSTVATRKAGQRRAIEDFDLDRLLALQEKMGTIIDTLTKNVTKAELSDTPVLSDERATALMAEFLDEREVAEVLDVRRDMIKDEVFSHLDEVEGPGCNGAIEVRHLGKKFCREGAGHGTPSVDEQRLQGLLGERWLEACEEEVIPAQIIPERIEYRLSIEKVLDLAQRDPEVLEALRTCLVPGKAKTPRMVVRDL